MFQLVKIVPGSEPSLLLDTDGKPFVFETGREAAEKATALMSSMGIKVQPRKIVVDDTWKERERARFDSGEYTALPYWFKQEEDHFAHHSNKHPGKIAYTKDAASGVADRQTTISCRDYLSRLTPSLYQYDIDSRCQRWEAEFGLLPGLHLAKTADEIERVYTNGPHSCMAGSSYDSDEHPTRVYAAGDLAVAYLMDDKDNITSRCLCWPDKKIRGRIYVDEAREDQFVRVLESAGYRRGKLDGARLLKIESGDGRYVMPYIDDCQSVDDNGKYFTINGSIEASSTGGLIRTYNRTRCDCCNSYVPSDETTDVNGDPWCECCVDNHAFNCDHYGEYYSIGSAVRMSNGETWCQAAFRADGFSCTECGENCPDDEASTDSDRVCQECADSIEADRETVAEIEERNQVTPDAIAANEAAGQLRLMLPAPEGSRMNFRGVMSTAEEDALCVTRGCCACPYGTCEAIQTHRVSLANAVAMATLVDRLRCPRNGEVCACGTNGRDYCASIVTQEIAQVLS